jgi:hypothetical protein
LVDKGYHNGKQIEICKFANITTIVAQPEQGKVTKITTTNLVAQLNTIKPPIPTLVHKAKRCIQQGMAQEK